MTFPPLSSLLSAQNWDCAKSISLCFVFPLTERNKLHNFQQRIDSRKKEPGNGRRLDDKKINAREREDIELGGTTFRRP